jgi:hypothetical protein
MKPTQILLALAGTASAIDTYLQFSGCPGSGNSAVCTNQNPNSCCRGSSGDIFPSIGFRGIPTNWNLECRGHFGGNCNRVREIQPARNTNFVCLGNGPFSGAGYGFVGLKRRAPEFQCATDTNEGCADVQKPDTLLFADGAQYNITDLDDVRLAQMVCFTLSS